MTVRAHPVGGKLLTPFVKFMLVLWALGTVAGLYRFTQGLGAATAMNDGYPWGIWIAVDVVVGTGLASGGYALALVVFIFNHGRYHPLVRPALLTSLLGYSVAGVAVFFDVGRYWNLWRVGVMPWSWNGTSVLLEVALCMMTYVAVIVVELSPVLLEKLRESRHAGVAGAARRWLPRVERALPFVIALGIVLPTMHQSSLGSLLLVAGTKLHPLWHTGLLPLLFLLTSFGMGYAILFFESIFSSVAFKRPIESKMLGSLGTFVAGVVVAFVLVRFAGLMAEDKLALTVTGGPKAFFFWAEILILLAAAYQFLQSSVRASATHQLQAGLLALAGGALYRLDTFLVAFDPGRGWHYFPSIGEILVTLGLIATETVVYVVAVRRFPVLGGVALPATRPEPAGARQGAVS
ncbi:MAG TPA: Ni/Fe-hydrogenase cytochrome b subunit [Anaeromyxobacteraceae bacterium]|nr:Ni/Fe-hydrogenase cytochrome b subunit [Anaeromyxobacteraceae bacterium]